jgi:uncharacterized protein
MFSNHSLDGFELIVPVKKLGRLAGREEELTISLAAPSGLANEVIAVQPGQLVELEVLLEVLVEGVLVTGKVRAEATGECVRCLEQVVFPLEAIFQELFEFTGRVEGSDRSCRSYRGRRSYVVDDAIDLTVCVWDALVLALPFRPLCRDDCPGLCPECGVPMDALTGHGHQRRDARWAVLEDLLEDQKEER